MKITKSNLKQLIKEVWDSDFSISPEESAWAEHEEEANRLIVDDVEAAYEALLIDLESVEDPVEKADLLRRLQDILGVD